MLYGTLQWQIRNSTNLVTPDIRARKVNLHAEYISISVLKMVAPSLIERFFLSLWSYWDDSILGPQV